MIEITGSEKLLLLRQLMKDFSLNDNKSIQAYIITEDDAHQSEYIAEQDKRRQYISGFKGSLGTVVVTHNDALLWTDGRYFLQARMELDPPEAWTLMQEGIPSTPTLENWLAHNLPKNSKIGADPNLVSNATWTHLQNSLNDAGHILLPVENNLVDKIWGNEKPKSSLNEIVPHKFLYSGKKAGEKIQYCFDEMNKNDTTVLVITALDEIAYLLNWRGSDIPYNPVFFAYIILYSKKVNIFVTKGRITFEAIQQLYDEMVDFMIHPYENVRSFLKKICSSDNENKVWISNNASYALHSDCESIKLHKAITPVSLMKLIKNNNEIEGMKSAHIRDGIALVKYFSWLEDMIVNKKEESIVTEISGAEKLEQFRREQQCYVGPSFPTISAVGKHGAIIHYQPSNSTNVSINSQELYLCDAGAQFLDGTTDITRTVHYGQPTDFERECFTRVFKGQCNLAMSKFPSMIKGNYLDSLARKFLWDVGLNYLHGTGHGVGAYLNVHEFPTMISWRPYPDDPGLQAGMFLSNEPGYYEDEKFGIRLENIEMVIKANTKFDRVGHEYLTFDTITLVPIQTKLLEISLLTNEEIQFLNAYHDKCYQTLKPHLKGSENIKVLEWLKNETKPIQK